MTRMRIILLVIGLLLGSASARAFDGADVLGKMDTAEFAARDLKMKITMTLIDSRGTREERSLETYQQGSQKRLIRFLGPGDLRGMSFLDAGNDRLYVYLSAFQKVRRVAGHFRNARFAGTDFAYEDLVLDRFTARYDLQAATETKDHYVLTLRPKPTNKSQYSKVVARIRKGDFLFDQMELFDGAGHKWKVMTRGDFRRVNQYVFAFLIKMKDLKTNHETINKVESIACDVGLADRIFSPRGLER
jgi:hypothetical protein